MSTPSSGVLWAGRVLSGLPVLGLTASAIMKLTHQAPVVEGFAHFGFQESALAPIGVVELVCVLLYVIPQTSVLGALLTTAYLGGATATHVRLGEAPTPAIVLGILIWAGLGLREPRLQALLPLRKSA